MLTVSPSIAPEIYRIARFRALSICVKAAPVLHPDAGEIALREACEAVLAGEPEWAGSHLTARADVFQKFGAKPKRTPCSADALRKRVLRDGTMPALDPIVDLYNAVSLATPYRLVGRISLPIRVHHVWLWQTEQSLLIPSKRVKRPLIILHKEKLSGVMIPARPAAAGTGDRIRTRLGVDAQQMWFILESLPQMPLEKLHEAEDADRRSGKMMPACGLTLLSSKNNSSNILQEKQVCLAVIGVSINPNSRQRRG